MYGNRIALVDRVRSLLADKPNATVAATCIQLEAHPRWLARVLREDGTSYGELRTAARLERCLREIRNPGNRNLTVIASDCGFSCEAALSRFVRRLTGRPPSAYLREAPGNPAPEMGSERLADQIIDSPINK